MSLQRIEAILKTAMGLNAASIGSSAIQRAIDHRMAALRIGDINSYAHKLEQTPGELAELIELVVIPETWFFRDMNPFSALVDTLTRMGKARAGTTLRILSVPCSTGEEPYTIAMALAQAGFNLDDISIDAVDISARNIGLAERAQYTNNSFRSNDLAFRDRYFQQTRHGYHLKPEIKQRVNFAQHNILDAAFSQERDLYDIIFCRNLLIYFDRTTQARAIDVLEGLLNKDGLLFLGHAESGVLTGRNFEALPYERCFGFRRAQQQPATAESGAGSKNRTRRYTPPPRPTPARESSIGSNFFNSSPATPDVIEEEPLVHVDTGLNPIIVEAERLANEGHLVEAASQCEQFVQRNGPDASAFYLLGLIREATGESDEAIDYLRKAIYLDPQHDEAISHLALILSRQGQTDEAERLQARATRIQQRKAGNA